MFNKFQKTKKFLASFFGVSYLSGSPQVVRRGYGYDYTYPTPMKLNEEFNMARITPLSTGRFAIVNDGAIVADYARARDARRGAMRRGIALA